MDSGRVFVSSSCQQGNIPKTVKPASLAHTWHSGFHDRLQYTAEVNRIYGNMVRSPVWQQLRMMQLLEQGQQSDAMSQRQGSAPDQAYQVRHDNNASSAFYCRPWYNSNTGPVYSTQSSRLAVRAQGSGSQLTWSRALGLPYGSPVPFNVNGSNVGQSLLRDINVDGTAHTDSLASMELMATNMHTASNPYDAFHPGMRPSQSSKQTRSLGRNTCRSNTETTLRSIHNPCAPYPKAMDIADIEGQPKEVYSSCNAPDIVQLTTGAHTVTDNTYRTPALRLQRTICTSDPATPRSRPTCPPSNVPIPHALLQLQKPRMYCKVAEAKGTILHESKSPTYFEHDTHTVTGHVGVESTGVPLVNPSETSDPTEDHSDVRSDSAMALNDVPTNKTVNLPSGFLQRYRKFLPGKFLSKFRDKTYKCSPATVALSNRLAIRRKLDKYRKIIIKRNNATGVHHAAKMHSISPYCGSYGTSISPNCPSHDHILNLRQADRTNLVSQASSPAKIQATACAVKSNVGEVQESAQDSELATAPDEVWQRVFILCAACPNRGMFLCSGCHKVAYCSFQCQNSSWRHHRSRCKY